MTPQLCNCIVALCHDTVLHSNNVHVKPKQKSFTLCDFDKRMLMIIKLFTSYVIELGFLVCSLSSV